MTKLEELLDGIVPNNYLNKVKVFCKSTQTWNKGYYLLKYNKASNLFLVLCEYEDGSYETFFEEPQFIRYDDDAEN